MQNVIEALDGHVKHNGVEVEVQTMEGSWADMRDIVLPWATLLNELAAYCNAEALDEEQVLNERNDFVKGRSAMAHAILRRIAATQTKVDDD